ncbi:MAG: YlxR family protein [Armatimonadetes bacterium]|nr:YlxR family protein [Armatimonadota bacterium]
MTSSVAVTPAAHKVRRVPVRTCVACRTTGGKRGLLRVVRLPEGAGVVVDPTGKMSGRGAYVCQTPECVTTAQKRKAFERSLKVAITETVFDELRIAITDDSTEKKGATTMS